MDKGIISKISVLVVLLALSGCSGLAPQAGADVASRPILSAAEAEAEIRVTVRPLAPIADPVTIVAVND